MTTRHRDDLPSLREQLFVLAHDETRSLKPHLHVPAIGVGLAGAAVIDLLIAKRIHIAQGSPYLHRSYEQGPAGDPVTHQVLAMIGNLRHTPGLHLLLRELGPDLYDQTLTALIAKDVITRDRRWGRTRYELTRITPAARVRQKVRYRIEGRQRPDPHVDALCALTWALNLQHCLVMDLSEADIDELLRGVMHRIPELVRWNDPDAPAAAIPEVADAARTAVGAMATSPY
ncbi:GPP34 family phosphoprotein [Actinoplanes sp. NPDC049118]|uniref:GOLPH3/VPS74 family protein n=1 Tax=Actinoplanes sp. NPDC049118 TaxID=3155769 RepID=UPI0033EC4FAD